MQGTKDRWFVPTKLAANLSASIADSATIQAGEVWELVTCFALKTDFLRKSMLLWSLNQCEIHHYLQRNLNELLRTY